MDKTWMNCRNKLRPEYTNGVRSFIKFANGHMGEQSKIWCSCLRCMNVELRTYPTVQEHLLFNGIMTSYTAWILHGEPMPMNVEGVHDDSDDEGGSVLTYSLLNLWLCNSEFVITYHEILIMY